MVHAIFRFHEPPALIKPRFESSMYRFTNGDILELHLVYQGNIFFYFLWIHSGVEKKFIGYQGFLRANGFEDIGGSIAFTRIRIHHEKWIQIIINSIRIRLDDAVEGAMGLSQISILCRMSGIGFDFIVAHANQITKTGMTDGAMVTFEKIFYHGLPIAFDSIRFGSVIGESRIVNASSLNGVYQNRKLGFKGLWIFIKMDKKKGTQLADCELYQRIVAF